MRWEDVVSNPPLQVKPGDRDSFLAQGYLVFPELVGGDELSRLQRGLADLIEQSRSLTESTTLFDLEAGHSSEHPRLRRAACVDDGDPVFWEFCSTSVLPDIASDILGPDLRFRDAFANLKWADGGAAVDWHQDLAFYPHTNSGTCQFIVALDDITASNGPLTVIPGSHLEGMYSHYADDGAWIGAIPLDRVGEANLGNVRQITGRAGTVSVHQSLMLHYSAPNHSDTSRPVLVVTYAAADAAPYTAPPYKSSHYGEIVRGSEPGVAHHEEMTVILPPDWSHGYTSIFEHQESTPQEK